MRSCPMINLKDIDDKMVSSCTKLIECEAHRSSHASGKEMILFEHRIKVTLIGIPSAFTGLDLREDAEEYADQIIESFRRLYRLRNYEVGYRVPLYDNPITFTFKSHRSFSNLNHAELKLVKLIVDIIDKYPNTYCRLSNATYYYNMRDFLSRMDKKNFQGMKFNKQSIERFIYI